MQIQIQNRLSKIVIFDNLFWIWIWVFREKQIYETQTGLFDFIIIAHYILLKILENCKWTVVPSTGGDYSISHLTG